MFKKGQTNLSNQFASGIVNTYDKECCGANQGPFLLQKIVAFKSKVQKKRDHWTQQQQIKYVAFFLSFEKELLLKSKRINWNIYRLMGKFIKSRNPNQCRIHHIHMLKQHLTSKAIINHMGLTITNYKQRVLMQKESLCQMNHSNNLMGNLNHADASKVQAIYQISENQKNKVQKIGMKLQLLEEGDHANNKINEDNIRTDETYHDQGNKNACKRQSLQSLPLFKPPYNPIHPNQPVPCFGYNPEHIYNPFPLFNMSTSTDKVQGEWQQCHKLFLAWTTKLKKIMEQQ